MANIIHNLSTMTSYQYNPGHLAMTRVNLSLLLVRLCKAISTQFTDKKAIDIDIDIDIDKPVYISGNHVALEQMVMNLLSNAVKYTPAGGNVTASISKTPAEVIMSIKDTGIGMSDKDILRIFKPFYRSADKMAQEEKGSGLGLTIVNDIAKEHKAKIFVKSALKKGTEISVSFPATQ